MNRRTFLFLPVTTTLATFSHAQETELVQNSENFNDVWGIFLRKLLGCLSDERDPRNCRPQLGEVDYTAFRKCRELAKKLFVLDEKRP